MSYLVTAKTESSGGGSPPVIIYPPGTVFTNENTQFEFTSTVAISAPRVVYAGASGPELADKDTISQQDKIIGVTITSASGAGEPVKVVTEGKIEDPSFTFSVGPIYLGVAGVITQVRPTTGLLVQIGVAISATLINVNIQMAIKLA